MAPPRRSVKQRILERISEQGSCWIWTGSATRDGYGVIGIGRNNQVRVHRAAYSEWIGSIPAGMVVCHRCDTPRCVNPDHLFLGTPADNTRDMIGKGRRPVMRGADHPNCKIGPKQRKQIARLRNTGLRLTDIAGVFGVSFQTVSRICQEERNAARHD